MSRRQSIMCSRTVVLAERGIADGTEATIGFDLVDFRF